MVTIISKSAAEDDFHFHCRVGGHGKTVSPLGPLDAGNESTDAIIVRATEVIVPIILQPLAYSKRAQN